MLGVGNLLLSDDGVGVHTIRRLQEVAQLSEEVQVLDGGTMGLDLLYYLEGVSHLLIVDAVEMGEEPGTVVRLEGDEVPSFLSIKMSPHQIGIPDMLFAAKLKDLYPPNLVLWGVQPAALDVGLELSPVVAAQVDALVSKVVEQLVLWGEQLRRKNETG